jgi:hypothetical protein
MDLRTTTNGDDTVWILERVLTLAVADWDDTVLAIRCVDGPYSCPIADWNAGRLVNGSGQDIGPNPRPYNPD